MKCRVGKTICEKLTMALAGDFGANASRKVSLARYWANFLARNSIYCYSFARPSRRVSLCNVVRLHCCHSFPCQRYCHCHRHCCHLHQQRSSTTTMSTVALLPTAFVVAAVTCCSSQLSSFSLAHCSAVARVWSHSSLDWWSECTPSSSTRDGCPWTRCWAHQSRLKSSIRFERRKWMGWWWRKKKEKERKIDDETIWQKLAKCAAAAHLSGEVSPWWCCWSPSLRSLLYVHRHSLAWNHLQHGMRERYEKFFKVMEEKKNDGCGKFADVFGENFNRERSYSHFNEWKAVRALGLVKLAPSLSSRISCTRSITRKNMLCF